MARASDFFGPGAADSSAGERLFDPILAGKTVRVLGDPDALHSHTYLPDFARAHRARAPRRGAWGGLARADPEAVSVQRLVQSAASAVGTTPKLAPTSKPMLRLAGLFVPILREFPEMWYEFAEPFVLDSSEMERAFGIARDRAARAWRVRPTSRWGG